MVDQLSAGGRAIPNPAVPKEGVQDQSSSNRHWSNGTSQHCAILPPAMRNTATVCQVRSWPLRSSWGRPAAPPAGRRPRWRLAAPERSPWRGPGGRRNSPRPPDGRGSDRRSGCARAHARQCHPPAGPQGRSVVPTGIEGCLGPVEGLDQPHAGVRPALTGPGRPVTNHRGEASASRTAGYQVVGPRPRRGSA